MSGRYPPTLFVVGTDQDVGKTAACMGIISQLLSSTFGFSIDDIGYMKPVGQQTVVVKSPEEGTVEVDKDAFLISSLYGLTARPFKAISPVLWTAGATAEFIDEACAKGGCLKSKELQDRVCQSYEVVAQGRKVVVCEGTGQSGVGSVAGLSNGDVIRLLSDMGVPVVTVLVTRGGIGSTIDRFFPHVMSLMHLGCRVDCLLINGVRGDKFDKVKEYLKRYYTQVFLDLYGRFANSRVPPQILGLIPEVPELRLPTMRLLAEAFANQQIDRVGFFSPAQSLDAAHLFVRGVKVRSLDSGYEPYLEDGDVVIVGINANAAILELLQTDAKLKSEGRLGLSGLILSCSGAAGLSTEALEAILQAKVPTMVLPNDSADIVRRIAELPVKIQPYDHAKKACLERAYRVHLDVAVVRERLLHAEGLVRKVEVR